MRAPGRSLPRQPRASPTTSLPIGLQAVTPVTVVDFPFELITSLQRTDSTVVRALAAEATRRLAEVYRTFAATFFGTFRERLAAHLLDTRRATARRARSHRTCHPAGSCPRAGNSSGGRRTRPAATPGGRLSRDQARWRRHNRPARADWRSRLVVGAVARLRRRRSGFRTPRSTPRLSPSSRSTQTDDVIYANPAVEATFGRSGRDVLGQQLSTLMPLPMAVPWAQMFSGFMDSVAPGPIGLGDELPRAPGRRIGVSGRVNDPAHETRGRDHRVRDGHRSHLPRRGP